MKAVIARNQPTFNKLLLRSIIMFVSSIGSFFAFRSERVSCQYARAVCVCPRACGAVALLPHAPQYPAALFSVTDPSSRDIVGLIAAVLVTNLNIAAYVWMAFTEDDEGAAAEGKLHRS